MADQPKLARNVSRHVIAAAAGGPIEVQGPPLLSSAAGHNLGQSPGYPGLSDREVVGGCGGLSQQGGTGAGFPAVEAGEGGGESFLKGQPLRILLFRGSRAGQAQLSPSSCFHSRTAMISQFFILSSKGDPLIYKDCILDPRGGMERLGGSRPQSQSVAHSLTVLPPGQSAGTVVAEMWLSSSTGS